MNDADNPDVLSETDDCETLRKAVSDALNVVVRREDDILVAKYPQCHHRVVMQLSRWERKWEVWEYGYRDEARTFDCNNPDLVEKIVFTVYHWLQPEATQEWLNCERNKAITRIIWIVIAILASQLLVITACAIKYLLT